MSSLSNTDLVPVPTPSGLYLYYQQGAQILEACAENGSAWTQSTVVVGDKAQDPASSPITAYYVNHDGTSDPKNPVPAIHVFYIDSDNAIRERVKVISKGVWEERLFPAEFVKAPVSNSRISSGFCHDEQIGAHQWFYFEKQKGTGSEIIELRSGDASDFKWVERKDLPEDFGAALPGSSLATNLTNPTTHLFFQDHAYNVHEVQGGYEKWYPGKVIIKSDEVEANTPLAACDSTTADKPHLFYADGAKDNKQIRDYQAGNAPVGPFYPGTKLGAALFDKKPHLFYREIHGNYSIVTQVHNGTSWGQATHVIQ